MSSMLEEAIIDAQALREAAIQSAEQAVLAKYSSQIKDTVESLLEQDEAAGADPAAQGTTYGGGADAPKDKDNKSIIEDQLDEYKGKAYAFGDLSPDRGFELHPDEEIEIDLQKIVAESKNLLEIEEDDLKDLASGDEDTDVAKADDDDDDDEDGDGPEDGDDETASLDPDMPGEEDLEAMVAEVLAEMAEEGVIEEKLKLDFEAQPSGWMARPKKVLDEEATLDLLAKSIAEMELELTKEHKQVVTGLNGKIGKLNESLKLKNKENERLEREVESLYEAIDSLKTKFDEMTLINAKLLYTNKVLNNDAYNSRQKNEIVESIQTADSVEKAKIVYETLQSAVGARLTGPKSLSEAVDRRTKTSMILRADNQAKKTDNLNESLAKRMKTLAGINK